MEKQHRFLCVFLSSICHPQQYEKDRQCTYNLKWGPFTKPLLPWKSNKYYIFLCVCVCVCVRGRVGVCLRVCSLTQHVKRMRRAILSSVASLVPPNISTSYKRHNFRKKKSLNTKYVLWFSLRRLFKTFLVLRSIQRDTVINEKTSSCKVLVIRVGF